MSAVMLNDEQRKKFASLAKNICEQMSSADEEATSLIEKVCEQYNKEFDKIFNDLL
jgi:chromosome segregation ATPase